MTLKMFTFTMTVIWHLFLIDLRCIQGLSISSTDVVSVCLGGQLSLTCTINASFIQWNINIPHFNPASITRQYSKFRVTTIADTFTINETDFDILKTSDRGAVPIVSTLSITNASIGLNGTLVQCMEVDGTMDPTLEVFSATINISTVQFDHVSVPNVTVSREIFNANQYTVFLDLNEEQNDVVYNITAIPQESITILLSDDTNFQLTLAYNTAYNVKVAATSTLCQLSSITTSMRLRYVKCDHPLQTAAFDEKFPQVVEFNDPALEQTTVTFSCPPGLVLTGPNSSTCMGNGEWEPDPREVKCKANCGPPSPPTNGYILPYLSTLEGTSVEFTCQRDQSENASKTFCDQMGSWSPDPATVCKSDREVTPSSSGHTVLVAIIVLLVSVSILSSILFYAIGTVSGCFCRRCKCKQPTDDTSNPPAPLYDSVHIIQEDMDKKNIELRENVAYGRV